MSDNQQHHNSPDDQHEKKTEILPTYLEDASQLPPNVRLVGQDQHGNLIYEEVPVQSQGAGTNDYLVPSSAAAGAAGAMGAAAGAAGAGGAGGYGGGYGGGNYYGGQYPGGPGAAQPSQPDNDDDDEKSNPAVIVLSVLLVLLLIGIIALLGLIFIPDAPLNNVADNGTVTTSITETESPTTTTEEEDEDEDFEGDFADLVVRLPRGYVLSDPIEPVEGEDYRIVNPCSVVEEGETCTSEEFAEAMQEAYIENDGLDGDMRFYAESPITNESYPVKCEAQNGGKVLCVSGRDGSAAIIIDY